MVKLYVDLIRAGKKTLEQVPEKWREAVSAVLKGQI